MVIKAENLILLHIYSQKNYSGPWNYNIAETRRGQDSYTDGAVELKELKIWKNKNHILLFVLSVNHNLLFCNENK